MQIQRPDDQLSTLAVEILSQDHIQNHPLRERFDRQGFAGRPRTSLVLEIDRELRLYIGLDKEQVADRYMRAGAIACREARRLRQPALIFCGIPDDQAQRDLAMGTCLAQYEYRQTRTPDPENPPFEIESIWLEPDSTPAFEQGVRIAQAMNRARLLGDLPGNIATPEYLATQAREIAAEGHFDLDIYELEEIESMGMGAFASVARGSREPARLIVLERRTERRDPPIMLVGKGLTFDSGGISLKPAAGMEEMKFDMCGGAAVLGTCALVSALQLDIDLVAIVPASENLPAERPNKPGDIVRACNGTSIEIINTDAEGRLLLCDALAWGIETWKPRVALDAATLTGACVVALGSHHIGMMTNQPELGCRLAERAAELREPLWMLPATAEYDEQLKSDYADVKNVGGKEAGTITAGMFLKRFVGDTPWVHLDIAGTAWNVSREYFAKGATGSGVRAMFALIQLLGEDTDA